MENKNSEFNVIKTILIIVGAVTAVAAIAYAVYRFFFEDEFDAFNLRREARNNNATVSIMVHDASHIFADIPFGMRMRAWAIDVGRFVQK